MKFCFVFIIIIFSCSPLHKFNKDKQAFNSSAVIKSFKSVADMNDSYFVIRENNFFEFYRELFDSLRNTHYPGTYTLSGDTMVLKFYNKKGEELLGKKALISKQKDEIIFFNRSASGKTQVIP